MRHSKLRAAAEHELRLDRLPFLVSHLGFDRRLVRRQGFGQLFHGNIMTEAMEGNDREISIRNSGNRE